MSKNQNCSLQKYYDEIREYLLALIDEHNCTLAELRYTNGFIHCKNPDDRFQHFQKHAHEAYDKNLQFSHLTL